MPAETIAELLKEAKRLDREATKGPWGYGKAQDLFDDYIEAGFNFDEDVIVRDDDPNGDDDPEFVATTGTEVNTEETAAFIAFARTALPRLVALVEAAVEWEAADTEYINAEPPVPMARLMAAERRLASTVRGSALASPTPGAGEEKR